MVMIITTISIRGGENLEAYDDERFSAAKIFTQIHVV